jgi:hypothetical protein
MKPYKLLLNISGIGWSVLGFNRGINDYEYRIQKQNTKLYSMKIWYGVFGVITYLNPVLLIFTIPKEIYRIEVNLRNMDDEKKTNFYNSLL